MSLIRFLSPRTPDLVLPAVPATFTDGVCDIEDSRSDVVRRMRYLGTPHGVVEVGAVALPATARPEESEPRIPRQDAAAHSIATLQPDGTVVFRELVPGLGLSIDVNEMGNFVISLEGA